MLRHMTGSTARHGHRICALVDAQAVLGAVCKGRSSVGTLQREVRRVGALTMACDLVVRYCYMTSESNPADAPSRGLKAPVSGVKQRSGASHKLGTEAPQPQGANALPNILLQERHPCDIYGVDSLNDLLPRFEDATP